MSVATDLHELATRALNLLDAGDVPGARALLAAAAESPSRHDEAATSGDEDHSARLARAAAGCAMGVDPSLALFMGMNLANAFRSAGAIVPRRGSFGELAVMRADSWNSFLDPGRLAELKVVFVSHPEQLRSARECMARTAGMPQQLQSGPSDALGSFLRSWEDLDPVVEAPNGVRDWLSRLLSVQTARRAAGERASKRLISWASKAGVPQREVADWIGKPQTYVFRQLKAIEQEPSSMALTPRELYEHHVAREIDRPTFLALLAAFPYEPGSFPPDEPYWGYVPGTLDELTELAAEGRISSEELELVLAGIEAMAHDHG